MQILYWTFVFFLVLSIFFLNYTFSLYSDVLFLYDLVSLKKKNGRKKIEKLFFIIKNDLSLSLMFLLLLCILNVFYYRLLSSNYLNLSNFFSNWFNFKENGFLWNFFSIISDVLIGIITAVITEFISRFCAVKTKKRVALWSFFLNFTYALTKLGSVFFPFQPKKKVTYLEKDIVRYINNLAIDNIVEKEEASLVQAAFNFDDLKVKSIMIPLEKLIFLEEKFSLQEVKDVCRKKHFNCYPVIDSQKKFIGVFQLSSVVVAYYNHKDQEKWKKLIKKKKIKKVHKDDFLTSFLDIAIKDYLDLIVVVNKENELEGAFSLKDLFRTLVGKQIKKKSF